MKPQGADRSGWIVWGFLVPAALLLRLHGLGERSLWLDEATSVALARLGWGELGQAIWSFEGNMSLYFLALRGWTLFGEGEASIRLLSVLLGAGSVPALFLLGRDLWNPFAATAAAALLAFNPLHIRYSQEARSYALLILLAIVSTNLFVRALRGNSSKTWVAYTVTTAGAVYSHFFGIWLIPAHLAALAGVHRRSIPWRSLATSLMGLAVLLAPAALYVLMRDAGQLAWVREPGASVVIDFFRRTAGYSRMLLLPLVLFAAAGLFAGLRWPSSREAPPADRAKSLVPLAWLAVPIAGTWLVSLSRPVLYPRFLLLCLPAFLLLAGAGVTAIAARTRVPRIAALATVLLLCGLSVRTVLPLDRMPGGHGHDWRAATRDVLDRAGGEDGVLFYTPLGRLCFEYYVLRGPHADAPAILYPRRGEPHIYEDLGVPAPAQIESLIRDRATLWLVLSDAWLPGTGDLKQAPRVIREAIDREYILEDEREFPGDGVIVVRRYRRDVNGLPRS